MTQLLDHPLAVRVDTPGDPHLDTEVFAPSRRPLRREAFTTFALAFAAYLVAAWNLAVRHHAIVGDAMARVANAYYVGFSRDPHLAAVGFVWNPLPSFATLPVLSLQHWIPVLRTQGFAGNIVSAAFMAGSVAIVLVTLRELGASRVWRWSLTTLYAAHPLILLYGANGDSEATLVFFLALTCLALLRWFDRRDLRSIVGLGAALGLGYLSRQEFLVAGTATLACILVVTYRTSAGTRRHRRWDAATEATLAGLPFGFSVVAWAGAAWILVGSATSYLDVNRAQVDGARVGIAVAAGGTGLLDRLGYSLEQAVRLEPLGPAVVVVALVLALARRDGRIAAPLLTFGSVLAAQVALFAGGSTFGWLRFSITAIPLTVLAAGLLVAPRREGVRDRARASGRRASRTGLAVVALVAALVALPSAAAVMSDPRLAREEAGLVALLPGYGWTHASGGAYRADDYAGFDRAAAWFDSLRLRDGSVLTDTQYTFPLVLKTDRPHQFVIPSDLDYERSVADPATYHVAYLIVSDGSADTITASYPELRTARRTRIARLVKTFTAGPAHLRVFRVTGSVTGARAEAPRR